MSSIQNNESKSNTNNKIENNLVGIDEYRRINKAHSAEIVRIFCDENGIKRDEPQLYQYKTVQDAVDFVIYARNEIGEVPELDEKYELTEEDIRYEYSLIASENMLEFSFDLILNFEPQIAYKRVVKIYSPDVNELSKIRQTLEQIEYASYLTEI